jgi:hypothetical protein
MAKRIQLAPPTRGGIIEKPEDRGVELDLGDGVVRIVRYSIATVKRMHEMGLQRNNWTDPDVPTLVWLGLHDDAGNPPADVTLEQMTALPPYWLPYLGGVLVAAYHDSFPPQKPVAPAPDGEKKLDPTTTVQ